MFSREEVVLAVSSSNICKDKDFAKFLKFLSGIHTISVYKEETKDAILKEMSNDSRYWDSIISGLLTLYVELRMNRCTVTATAILYKEFITSPMLAELSGVLLNTANISADDSYSRPLVSEDNIKVKPHDLVYELIVLLLVYNIGDK